MAEIGPIVLAVVAEKLDQLGLNYAFVGGSSPEISADTVKGRFAQFLPEVLPDEQTRKAAKQLLALKGISQSQKKERGQEYGRGMF